jgi:pimeloyl-ACP methyl ester carboxylesterase
MHFPLFPKWLLSANISIKTYNNLMTNSSSLTVIEKGDSQKLPLVLIHGGAGGVWTWDELLKFLPEFHCYLPELPEHGSSQANGPFTVKSTAQSIINMIRERVPGGNAHVFGLSVGGQIVVEMLAQAPDVFSSAIISGAQLFPIPGYRLGIYSEKMMALIYWLGILPWKHNDGWIRWNMRSSAGISEVFFDRFKANFQGLTRDTWSHVMSENYRYRTPAGLENVTVPTLLIAGAHEKMDIQPTNRMLKTLLPDSRSIQLSSALGWSAAQEHNWPLNAPELCARVIKAWVFGQPLPDELIELS